MRHTSGIFFVVLLLVADSRSVGAEPGLVARWDFDRGKGSRAEDTSGNGNEGVVSNCSAVVTRGRTIGGSHREWMSHTGRVWGHLRCGLIRDSIIQSK